MDCVEKNKCWHIIEDSVAVKGVFGELKLYILLKVIGSQQGMTIWGDILCIRIKWKNLSESLNSYSSLVSSLS